MARIYRKKRGRDARVLREDFCSTAALATAWAKLDRDNRAIGVDFDPEPLAWARKHRFPTVPELTSRIELVEADVRVARKPAADIACGLNFSWWIFRERKDLLAYLRASRQGLRDGGMLLLNAYGGTYAERSIIERSKKKATRSVDGRPLPAFTYVWEQAHVNAVDRNMLAYIHFEIGRKKLARAFTYDWRLWTMPELRDVALEAGFGEFEVYAEVDGHVSKKKLIDNHDCWFTNAVCWR